MRFLKTFWIIFVVPAGTLLFLYFYPSFERKSLEGKIDQELPFATIHMAAISGSMIEPTKIFSIISSTDEYPNLEKEFNKLLNEINIYGYDLVTALKDRAINCPSQKLGDLFNGLATICMIFLIKDLIVCFLNTGLTKRNEQKVQKHLWTFT